MLCAIAIASIRVTSKPEPYCISYHGTQLSLTLLPKLLLLFKLRFKVCNRPFAKQSLITSGVWRTPVMYGRYRENGHFQPYQAAAESRILQSCCDRPDIGLRFDSHYVLTGRCWDTFWAKNAELVCRVWTNNAELVRCVWIDLKEHGKET